MGKLFGTDGIRGMANEYPITPEMAMKIGRAIARLFKQEGCKTRIIIGKDTRISGDMLEHALVAGICSGGADALLAGVLPTPGVAFMTRTMALSAGVMISASHNPFHDNGIKIFRGDGFKLSDATEGEIEKLILQKNLAEPANPPQALGRAHPVADPCGRYVSFLKNEVSGDRILEGLHVILDCANGATLQAAPLTFSDLGATVRTLFAEADGSNINLNCGSEHLESLAEKVVKSHADVGFAFDGDGDRVIAVDERGSRLGGDQMLAICARVMKEEGRLANDVVVSTVMSNLGLGRALKRLGVEHVITQVGDRHVLQEMRARGACIGGEDSGHMIFLDHQTTGDGIMTALKVIGAMKKTGHPLSELSKIMKVFPQCLINVEVNQKPALGMVPEIVAALDHAEQALGEEGRVLVRYSGTQPMCRVMVEGPSYEETEKHCREIAAVVRRTLA